MSHTEFVKDVNAPLIHEVGPVVTIALNSANGELCPWLSRVALGYELYRFRRLEFTYTPTCSTTRGGMIVMAVDYDATDAPPANKQAISGYDGSVRSNIWAKLTLRAKPMAGWYYTGMGGVTSNPAGTDKKLYDLGNFYLGVYNHDHSGAVGELAVSYDVEFMKPDYTAAVGFSEFIYPTQPSFELIGGTTQAQNGQNVFSIINNGPGSAILEAHIAGDYLLTLEGFVTASSSITNPFVLPIQKDPHILTEYAYPWTQGILTGTSNGIWLNLLAVSVRVGSTILLTALPSVTALKIIRSRVATYKKSLEMY